MTKTTDEILELETTAERCVAIHDVSETPDLLELANRYNWDDGLDVPRAIMNHPSCDLGLALSLFELAEGIVYLTEQSDWKHQEAWANFCEDLSKRIENGEYSLGETVFQSGYSKLQIFKFQKAGVNEIYFSPLP